MQSNTIAITRLRVPLFASTIVPKRELRLLKNSSSSKLHNPGRP